MNKRLLNALGVAAMLYFAISTIDIAFWFIVNLSYM